MRTPRMWVMGGLVTVGAIAVACSVAFGHGEAGWIEHEPRYVAPSGTHCCGEKDCERAPRDAVRRRPGGWEIVATGQIIADGTRGLYASIDHDFWWCRLLPPDVRCLFVPLEGA